MLAEIFKTYKHDENGSVTTAIINLQDKQEGMKWHSEAESSCLVELLEFLFTAKSQYELAQVVVIASDTVENCVYTITNKASKQSIKVVHTAGTCTNRTTLQLGLSVETLLDDAEISDSSKRSEPDTYGNLQFIKEVHVSKQELDSLKQSAVVFCSNGQIEMLTIDPKKNKISAKAI